MSTPTRACAKQLTERVESGCVASKRRRRADPHMLSTCARHADELAAPQGTNVIATAFVRFDVALVQNGAALR